MLASWFSLCLLSLKSTSHNNSFSLCLFFLSLPIIAQLRPPFIHCVHNLCSGTFFLSNVLMIPVFYIKPELYDSTPVLLVTSFMSLATLVSTVILNMFFFMVKTCDKTATTKTFLGTLYESTQQNVIQLDVLIAFAVIVYIYLEYKKSEPTVEKNYSDPFAPNSVY